MAIGTTQASILALALAGTVALPVAAKDRPAAGSWRIEPVTLGQPRIVRVGAEMTTLLRQRIVPEAAVLTETAVSSGTVALPAASGLIRVTTKQGTAWCAIEPLRVHPGKLKTSFASSLLLARKIVETRETPCFADSDSDGRMDQLMTGTERGYVLPTINKLGKPAPIVPFSVRETDAAALVSYPLELQASLLRPKNEPPHLIFSLMVSSGTNSSQIVGFRLVKTETDSVSFAGFSNLAPIDAEFSNPVPARVVLGAVGDQETAEVRVENGIEARNFGLRNILAY